jgi:hypothetical protein
MLVTRSTELLVNVPLPPGQGSSEHDRVSVVEDEVAPELLIVLVTVTVQVMPVVAPAAPGPTLLHWSMVMLAAEAGATPTLTAAADSAAVSSTPASSAGTEARRAWRAGREASIGTGRS